MADEVEQASKVRLLLEVPYWTQDCFSASYVFQPTEMAKKMQHHISLVEADLVIH